MWYFGLTLALRSWSCFGFSLFCFQYQRCLQNQNSVKLVGGTLLRCPNKPFMNSIHSNLGSDYKQDIINFENKWMVLYQQFQLPFSNKCHVIIEHVPQAIERSGASLYLTSEQVVEASHQKFSVFWERYKVLDLERPMHGDNLLACVIDFNSCNMWNVKWKIKSTCTDNSWSKY